MNKESLKTCPKASACKNDPKYLSKQGLWNLRSSVETHHSGLDISVGSPVQLFDSPDGVRGPALGLEVAVVADPEHVGVVAGAAVVARMVLGHGCCRLQ